MDHRADTSVLPRQGSGRTDAPQDETGDWHALVTNSPVAVAVLDVLGNFVYANPRAVGLYAATDAADLLGRPASDFVQPGSEAVTRDLFVAALRGETIEGLRWVLRRLDGAAIDVEIYATRVVWQHEPAVQVELRNVSAQVAAETALRESEQRWRELVDGSPVGIGLSDERGRFVAANAALCALFGRAEADVVGHSSAEWTHPDDLDSHRQASALINDAPDGVYRLEKRYLRPDGTVRWAWLTITHTPGPHDETWTLAHVQDITERRAAEQAIADSEANLTSVAKVVKLIQSGSDARQTVVDAAYALSHGSVAALIEPAGSSLRVTASSDPDLVGHEVGLSSTSVSVRVFRSGESVFIPDTAHDPVRPSASKDLAEARSMYVVPVGSAEAVTGVLVVAWREPTADLGSRRPAVVALLADHAGVAMRQATLLAELEALALTDALTGLPNRRSWEQRLASMLAVARRRQTPLTVALADLDHFKQFNDSHGHLAGDSLLRHFAIDGREAVREVDLLARWGGEEFAIALPECPASEAPAVLARIAGVLPADQTCSIGYAIWDGTESGADLIARADRALYAAKRAGRNRIECSPVSAYSHLGR